ncbi:MAG: hypothetical protein ACREV4_02320 [Gammaproteobacteria bacterium]
MTKLGAQGHTLGMHSTVIAKILAHLGLPIRAPPRSPAQVFDRFQMGFYEDRVVKLPAAD